ncbi:hypothetical protein [Rubrobacter indicoceani]|uniref:hypothetical protein n=1 Tax=Rubrobacter indicoceani TaxID=2051957 RepID=UPI000E5A69FC|nr:hypothetical protein [Rubrobacter indicoceani]
MPIQGKVAKILQNSEIVINRGRLDSVRPGMTFEVFSEGGEEVWDPDTGETLGTVEEIKAHAEVTEVKDRLAVAKLRMSQQDQLGAAGLGDMQAQMQRIFGQMFGDDVRVQGFGLGQNPNDDDDGDDELESMIGGPLKDLSQVQVGDVVREVNVRRKSSGF